MAIVSIVHGPRPGSAASRRRASCQSPPTLRSIWPAASAPASAANDSRRRPGHGQRWPDPAAASAAGVGEQPGQAAAGSSTGSPCAAGQPARVGPGRRGGDLLAEHGPEGELGRIDGPRDPPAGRLADQGRQHRVGAEQVGHGHRVGVEVQQPPAAADGAGQVPQVGQGQLAADVIGRGRSATIAVPVRQPQRAPVGAVPPFLDAGHRRGGQVAEQVVGLQRGPERQPQRQRCPPRPSACPRPARSRSSVGDRANTSRTVSLKVRMLANPAANATSPIGSAVVSISSRAVCARCARASASGPAPSSASSCRSSWRTL